MYLVCPPLNFAEPEQETSTRDGSFSTLVSGLTGLPWRALGYSQAPGWLLELLIVPQAGESYILKGTRARSKNTVSHSGKCA